MKRFLSLLLAAMLLLCLCACGSGSGGTITRVEETPAPVEDTPAPVEEAPVPEASAEPTPGPIIEQPDLSDAPDTIGEAQQAILEQFILIDELVNIYKIKQLKPDLNMKVYASFDNGERICINRSYKKSFTEYLQRMRRLSE